MHKKMLQQQLRSLIITNRVSIELAVISFSFKLTSRIPSGREHKIGSYLVPLPVIPLEIT